MANELPSQEYLKECFFYNEESGSVFWKHRPESHFHTALRASYWNRRYSGVKAGTLQKTKAGYLYYGVTINRKFYKLHRVIWVYKFGSIKSGVIDHIDGDGTNNALSNLRGVSRSVNSKNTKISSRNTSGMKGVCWNKRIKRWNVRITNKSKERIELGHFKGFFEACCIRKSYELKNMYHENDGRTA